MKDVYSTSEAAQLLGLTQRTVQVYIKKELLIPERRNIGLKKFNVIRPEELRRFADEYDLTLNEDAAEGQ